MAGNMAVPLEPLAGNACLRVGDTFPHLPTDGVTKFPHVINNVSCDISIAYYARGILAPKASERQNEQMLR
jgi:hypothetical protein